MAMKTKGETASMMKKMPMKGSMMKKIKGHGLHRMGGKKGGM